MAETCGFSMRLAPGVALNPLGAVQAHIDVAVVIDGYGLAPLSGPSGLAFRERGGNEGGHRSVTGAADREPAPEAAIDSPSRFGIHAIENVVLVDEEAARAPKLFPLGDEVAVLIEDFDAVVAAVGDEQAAGRIHRQRMRQRKLPRAAAALAPCGDELAFFGELHDSGIGRTAMAVADEDIAIGRDEHVRRSIECVRTGAGNAGLAKGHEHLALRADLEHSVPLALAAMIVGRPHIAVIIDMQPMRMVEYPGTEAHHQISQWIEFGDRVHRGADAISSPTPVEHPQALAVTIERNLSGEPHPPPVWQIQPAVVDPVRVEGCVLLRQAMACEQR